MQFLVINPHNEVRVDHGTTQIVVEIYYYDWVFD